MPAQLIDGNLLSQQLRADVAKRAAALTAQGKQPGLAVILVGDSQASQVYVRNKVAACAEVGIRSRKYEFPADVTVERLLACIDALNGDAEVDGILVQLPLPPHIDETLVLERIAVAKDVDGFTPRTWGGWCRAGSASGPARRTA